MDPNEPGSCPHPPISPETDPRVYLAAERTFLAWIRTGLAMMGFGFVLARFGMFLREVAEAHPITPNDSPKFSHWFGVALVIIGAVVNLLAAVQHVQIVRKLKRGTARFDRVSAVGILVALALTGLGIGMVAFLVILGQ